MSFVSTNNKSGMGGLTTTTPPITGESGGVTADSVAGSVADAAEAAVEQAAGSLFGALPEPSGLVKAAVAAAQAAAAAGMAQDAVSAIVSAVAGGPGAHNVTVSGSAVPPGALLFASLDGGETLSELFSYVVQLKTPDTLNLGYVSPAANLPLKPMVGKDLCVNIELDGGGKRHISGLVTAARVVGHEGRSVTYELRMEPWVKLLTHTSDYKAFHNKTVVDILDEVLAEYPYPVEKRLVESYPVRTWQVQYGETDFDFLQRLMQEWGIYWWFEHSENSHTLVLADAISAHKACPDSPLVEWHQEVLVDFKNGDPDLPIIVGRTYNQDTMPPWGLPGMASQSGIFSHSLYGGPTNGNMLRFDDKTGAEEVKFHAEKDLNTTVKNNETHTVMVDRTKTIIKNETNSIGEDRNTTVTKNDGLSVKLAQTINIGTTYRLDVGDQFTLRCGNAALVLHKDGSIEFCGKQLMLHTSDVMQLIGKGIDMNPDGGTAVTADDIAPLPTSE
ncbi:hypothetical protein AB7Y34_004303 [Salmonella enterica]